MKFFLIATLIFSSITLGQASNINSSKPNFIDETIEKKIGQKIVLQLKKANALFIDPISYEYIKQLGKKLVTKSESPNSMFDFFIVNSSQINAFALPGGYIGINLGLIKLSKSESELAGVLAHEIAHVTQKHIHRINKKLNNLQPPMLLSLILASAAAALNPMLGQAAVMSVLAGSQQSAINFTRHHEQEADRVALKILHQANFNPFGLPDFFSRMHSSNLFSKSVIPEYLRTHPIDKNRVADTIGRAKQLPKKQYYEDFKYQIVKARINNTLLSNTKSKLPYYEYLQKNEPNKLSFIDHYAYILELIRNNEFEQANKQAIILNQLQPESPLFHMLLADTYKYLKQYKQAVDTLSTLTNTVEYPPLHLLYAEMLIRNNQAKDGATVLKKIDSRRFKHPKIYQLLAKSAYVQGKHVTMHEYQAKYFSIIGKYSLAVNQLKLAINKTNSKYYKQLLTTQLKTAQEKEKLFEKKKKKFP